MAVFQRSFRGHSCGFDLNIGWCFQSLRSLIAITKGWFGLQQNKDLNQLTSNNYEVERRKRNIWKVDYQYIKQNYQAELKFQLWMLWSFHAFGKVMKPSYSLIPCCREIVRQTSFNRGKKSKTTSELKQTIETLTGNHSIIFTKNRHSNIYQY